MLPLIAGAALGGVIAIGDGTLLAISPSRLDLRLRVKRTVPVQSAAAAGVR